MRRITSSAVAFVAVAFLTSAEYTASHADAGSFVTGLYETVLRRQPDPAGFGYWQSVVATGTRSRAAVADFFLTSTEAYLQAIDDYYRVFLGRTPSPSEEQIFLPVLESGATPAQITSVFLGSPEFIAREAALFCG